MSIKKALQDFYNHEAEKYYQTRKKNWHDIQWIVNTIKNHESTWKTNGRQTRKIKILELGCGGGRFCDYLEEYVQQDFDYTGVDLSQKLLDFAQKDHPDKKFICDDMTHFTQHQKQETYDYIILTAAFQHLPSAKEREVVMKHLYRILKYEGKLMMLNWAFSDRFKNKYAVQIRQSLWKYITSLGKNDYRDIMVPWQSDAETFHRYYHLFRLKELEQLAKVAGFAVQKICYLDNKGQCIDSQDLANNSLLIAEKQGVWG